MSGQIFHVESNDGETAILTQSADRYIYERADTNLSLSEFTTFFPAGGEVLDPSQFDKAANGESCQLPYDPSWLLKAWNDNEPEIQ